MAEKRERKEDREKRERLEEALKRFKLADDADGPQRDRELAALKFDALDQWPDWVKRTRMGTKPGSADNLGARPMLTIPLLDQPIAQVINQQKTSDLGLNVHPKGDSTQEDAELRQGLIRHIQVQSRAKMARNWAYERAVKVGRGYYEIRKVYTDDPQHPFDQDLRIDRILDQSHVLMDPFAQQPDSSDAEWAFKWSDLPEATFTRQYPKAKLSRANEQELQAQAEQTPGWIGGSEDHRTYRVAEYWYASYDPRTVTLYQTVDGQELVVWDEEPVPEGAVPVTYEDGQPMSRVVQQRRLNWCKITANEILEETPWEGVHIPLIPAIGKEFNLNGERKWMGIVEPAMDACRLVNFTASAIAEGVALAPKAPFTLDPEQIEGFEPQWNQANTRNAPYLPRRAFNDRGELFPPIERQTAEPPVQALSMLLGQAMGFVQNASSTPASALGQMDPTHRSGKAIKALQERSELANSNYLDNLASISMTLEGIILNEMLPYVYDRPGRVVQLLAEDNTPESVMLGVPSVKTPQGPQAAPPVPVPNQKVLQHRLTPDGQFGVVVDVGKSFSTRREEGAAMLGELLPNLPPEMAAAVMPDYVEELDFPKAHKLAATMRRTLPQALQEPDPNAPPVPPEIQAQIQQMQGQLQQAQQIIQTEQVKQQATMQKAQMDAQAKAQEAQVEAQVKLQIAQMEIASREKIALMQAAASMTTNQAKIDAEDARTFVDAMENRLSQQLDLHMQQLGHLHEAQRATQDHGQTLVEQAQQAALTPAPSAQADGAGV